MDNIVNITDYGGYAGASGAINSAAVVAAQAALVSAGGGYLVFPDGVFDIASAITLSQKVSLMGSGSAVTIIRASAAIATGMVRIVGDADNYRYGHRIESLSLYGASLAVYGIELAFAVYSNVMKNLFIRDTTSAGIYLTAQDENFIGGCWGNTIDNVRISYCGRGIHLGQAANVVRTLNSSISMNTGIGIYGDTATGVNIIGTTIEKNGTAGVEEIGIKVVGGTVWNISGCYFEGNGVSAGVDIETAPNLLSPFNVDGLTVQACYFNGLETFEGGKVTVAAKSVHALNILGGTVTLLGGYSWRHSGTAVIKGVGGVINNYGFVTTDRLGYE